MVDFVKMKTKVCLVGEPAVGKTSLIARFVLDSFNNHYVSTIGTKVTKKEIKLEAPDRNIEMDMTIWDIMGHKGFRQLLREAYFYGAQGIIAVCDLTRPNTLRDLDEWIDSIFRSVGKVPVIFVANKVDLKDEAKFNDREIQAAARGFDSTYYYTSAKTGENVEYVFKKLASSIAIGQFPSILL